MLLLLLLKVLLLLLLLFACLLSLMMILGKNPLECNCQTTWLKDFYDSKPNLFKGADPPSCKYPSTISGQTFEKLSREDFACQPPSFKNIDAIFDSETAKLMCSASGVPAPSLFWVLPSGQAFRYELPSIERNYLSSVGGVESMKYSLLEGNSNLAVLNLMMKGAAGNLSSASASSSSLPSSLSSSSSSSSSSWNHRVATLTNGMYVCVASNAAGNVTLMVNVSWPLKDRHHQHHRHHHHHHVHSRHPSDNKKANDINDDDDYKRRDYDDEDDDYDDDDDEDDSNHRKFNSHQPHRYATTTHRAHTGFRRHHKNRDREEKKHIISSSSNNNNNNVIVNNKNNNHKKDSSEKPATHNNNIDENHSFLINSPPASSHDDHNLDLMLSSSSSSSSLPHTREGIFTLAEMVVAVIATHLLTVALVLCLLFVRNAVLKSRRQKGRYVDEPGMNVPANSSGSSGGGSRNLMGPLINAGQQNMKDSLRNSDPTYDKVGHVMYPTDVYSNSSVAQYSTRYVVQR
ncbi:hypothetical protein HELRODRAFT_165504 [Helobdella robusta]|uniref:Ig-like domain-containing protein n=1 Tax=Helobdella robusta TaxID=6412 RepID=T1EWX6_HELRO|nr:hypothetical protein HELRODRAFT_165504 [Helobdella robusta]ESN91466.1 hypothetical protein HELRODRAFT_165504 [Helobdella robusta]